MNAEGLLAYYERIADAPDAVARLRQAILHLAVRGKLVPQDPGDEPAAELLKRVPTPAKPARYDKRSPELVLGDCGLSINNPGTSLARGWIWVPMVRIARLESGHTPSRNRPEWWGGTVPWIGLVDARLHNNGTIFETLQTTNDDGLANSAARLLPAGTVCFSRTASVGYVVIMGRPMATSQDFVNWVPTEAIWSRWLQLVMIAERPAINRFSKGAVHQTIYYPAWLSMHIALPPLAEQHRIVAKVDELMALCDRLAAASLARLNAPDPDTFRDDARFALDALLALTTRPDQIKQLRQTILNLAVRGKLVPQDPGDERIQATLKQAITRRGAMVRAGKVRQKKLDGYDALAADADLPRSWILERLGNLVDPENTISYGVLVPGEEVPDGVPFVRAQDLALTSHPERPNKTISPEIERAYARTRLRGGEILVCVVGSIGKLGIAPQSWAGANIARAVARISPISEISREYLLVVLRGQPVQSYFTETTRTLAQPTLNVGLIEQTPIPLPPLAEQRRIVAKVDELMTLCDRLEASLAAGESTRRRLLEALLAEALAPAVRDLDESQEAPNRAKVSAR